MVAFRDRDLCVRGMNDNKSFIPHTLVVWHMGGKWTDIVRTQCVIHSKVEFRFIQLLLMEEHAPIRKMAMANICSSSPSGIKSPALIMIRALLSRGISHRPRR